MDLAEEDLEALLCIWGVDGGLCRRLKRLEREVEELEVRLARLA